MTLVCWAALKQNPKVLLYIVNQTEEMCRYAVDKDIDNIRWVHDTYLMYELERKYDIDE